MPVPFTLRFDLRNPPISGETLASTRARPRSSSGSASQPTIAEKG